ncbi:MULTISPECIES: FAD-binding oxidoreductase [Methylobacterium]|uniref:NAD(P)/FAD-dependent oxidoreductase n=1 Tax=Methylobacterium TaxID=407 RepID=UPI00034A07F7|nr:MULTISPECIES: FAD-binding oxidoreductase [Methylobacterium]MBN4093906.1 FAD-binding oxidoreductase [Methylobacterium sp. OT2]UIN33653.1 FAD-binding oxidoreductase [Methylobacterium oryzae]SEG11020.1 Glycine/D-amino acid oxidase [Methylobacterium sp. 190mf]SEN26473.1 Glycine/D-amino acid oxidase [Methylobacterium sp. UNC300MFChir4.1]
MAEPFPLAPSLWATTAAPAPDTPPLARSGLAEVVIVGGGFCGLSTALHLAERGIRPVVLEAQEVGYGGSGRNGGQVIPGLKYDPADLVARFGRERGERLARFAGGTADVVFDLIARHGMDVPHSRAGWIQGAHTEAGLAEVAKRAAQWADLGAPTRVLDRAETEQLLGTDRYLGGWLDSRGGAIQPLSYARGLARAAQKAGATIHGGSPVTGLERTGSGWTVTTAQGERVTTGRVVLCTNGYTGGLWPNLARTVIAANSFQVATVPLTDNLRRSILPEGHVSSDTRKLLLYFRLDHTGRLLMGGRGPFREPRDPADWAHLERIVGKLFPQLDGIAFDHRWCGRVAITRDYLPHLHEPAPGLLIDIGCQGRGVGLQSAMGRAMAAYIATGDAGNLPLPLTPIEPLPLHGLNRLYVSAIIAWYRLRDGGIR